MLAEYNIPLPNSISWGEDPLLLGANDDLFHLDADLLPSDSDGTTLNGLLLATTFDLLQDDTDNSLQINADRYSQHDANGNRMDGLFGSPGNDYMTGAYLTALQHSEEIGTEVQFTAELHQIDLETTYSVELSDSDESLACSSLSVVNSCPGSPTAKRKKFNDLRWSEMDNGQQQRAVDQITRAITDQASIREQLELLRIIGQDMTVLPSDSRFNIDGANIDDHKLHSIREYLAQMALHTTAASEETFTVQHSTSPNETRHKKSLERRSRHKAHRKRRTKEKKQAQKEQQSSLFAHEEVLSLQLQDDNDEEINILD